jgi:hypothetical protein
MANANSTSFDNGTNRSGSTQTNPPNPVQTSNHSNYSASYPDSILETEIADPNYIKFTNIGPDKKESKR